MYKISYLNLFECNIWIISCFEFEIKELVLKKIHSEISKNQLIKC
ncbi:MAG: hypothetical protein HGGPFJEG_02990 [Ignavibacteria bacterium]|nr:hypothetical protein [Ignavibacteria bacterium]